MFQGVEGGGGVDGTILPAVETSRQDGVYLIATALLAACDVTKHGHHLDRQLGRYLGFNRELEIR